MISGTGSTMVRFSRRLGWSSRSKSLVAAVRPTEVGSWSITDGAGWMAAASGKSPKLISGRSLRPIDYRAGMTPIVHHAFEEKSAVGGSPSRSRSIATLPASASAVGPRVTISGSSTRPASASAAR